MSRHADLASTPAMRAAARLRETLTVRTHTRPAAASGSGGARPTYERKRGNALLFGKGGKARPVRIGRTVYESATQCARVRRISTRDLYDWLRAGVTSRGQICQYVFQETKP